MQHIIKKQVIDLTLYKKKDAFQIQHLISEHYWREVVPVIEKAFDAASSSNEIISIDTLEIDLGFITIKDIEKGQLQIEVAKKISEQLNIEINNLSSKQKTSKQAIILNVAGQWMFYMEHGYLPWNVIKINTSWYQDVLEAFATNAIMIGRLRLLIKNKYVVRRIIFQHDEKFLQSLIETLTAEKQEALAGIINEITELLYFIYYKTSDISSFEKKELKQKIWQQTLELIASKESKLSPEKIAFMLLRENSISKETIENLPGSFLFNERLTADVLKQIKKAPADEKQNEFKEKKSVNKEIENSDVIKIAEDGIFVQYAGLVLLHPFLKVFFKNLSLVSETGFVDVVSHQKALYLLNYFATGNTKPEEHELVIPKILCAWSIEEPVDNNIELMPGELAEADNLLAEVIQQWEVLKGTSINGLREEFLQRNGKFYTKNENLYLQVESNSIDILLDYLPWSLNIINLPWMSNVLRIEWR